MDSRPIAIFDSGFGGITLWRAIREALPEESLIYFGDGANCPYGAKSREQIVGYTTAAVERLLARDVKIVVIACNTATAYAIAPLREKYPHIDFVGLEPAIKPACEATKSGVVGLLATEGSLNAEKFKITAQKYGAACTILNRVGEGFVEIVEQGLEHSPKAFDVVRPVIEELLSLGADQLILGCTHYPFLRDVIEQVVGDRDVAIIDPAPAVAKRVIQLLSEREHFAPAGNIPIYDFDSFADGDYIQQLFDRAFEK